MRYLTDKSKGAVYLQLYESLREDIVKGIYAYGENSCFMPAPYEMKKLYREGLIGEFEYGEGEYIHDCTRNWASLTYGDKNHWRNNMYANFIAHIPLVRLFTLPGSDLYRLSALNAK